MTKKHRCEACGHVHRKSEKGTSWNCVVKGCKCLKMVVAGREIG